MNILITRPINESIELAQTIENSGHTAIIAPLLEIEHLNEISSSKGNFIITSKNAAFAVKNSDKNIKIFVIGNRTKDYINQLGFHNVYYMGETVAQLKERISQDEQYIYLSGNDVTDPLSDFSNVKRLIVYNAKKVENPSEDFINFFLKQEPGICMIFSQRTAEIFYSLVNKYDLKNKCDNIILLAFSSKIANSLKELRFKTVKIAKKPDMQNMLDLLNLYKNG